MKVCTGCKKKLNLDKFPPDKRAKDGKQSRCRKCIRYFIRMYYYDRPVLALLQRARDRAKKKNLTFNIIAEDITPLPTHCPVFGSILTRGDGHQNPNAFSLDRIDSSKGYVRGNVAVISYLANRLKNDGTVKQHKCIAAWMRSKGVE